MKRTLLIAMSMFAAGVGLSGSAAACDTIPSPVDGGVIGICQPGSSSYSYGDENCGGSGQSQSLGYVWHDAPSTGALELGQGNGNYAYNCAGSSGDGSGWSVVAQMWNTNQVPTRPHAWNRAGQYSYSYSSGWGSGEAESTYFAVNPYNQLVFTYVGVDETKESSNGIESQRTKITLAAYGYDGTVPLAFNVYYLNIEESGGTCSVYLSDVYGNRTDLAPCPGYVHVPMVDFPTLPPL